MGHIRVGLRVQEVQVKEMASAGGRRWTRRQLMVSAIASALVGCSGGESDGATAAGTATPDGAATTSEAPATEAGSTSAVATDATDATVPTTTTPATTTTTPPTTTAPTAGPYFPTADTWETVVPEEVGWSTEGLEALATTVGDARSSSFTVSSGGRLMVERYWMGATDTTVTDVASVQKSVTSTLVGIAADRGLLGLDDAVSDHLGDGWSAAVAAVERRITLRHLMTHSSGLHPDTMRRAAAPGTTFDYNTFAYQKLRLVLEAAAGLDINALSRAWLFDPIGLSGTAVWEERPGAVDAVGATQWGLMLTARDMARVGLLALAGGRWGEQQVVPDGWFAEAWTPSEVNDDYGLLWWLMGRGPLQRIGAPDDWVAALGAQGQKLYVVPSLDLVVTRQGLAPGQVSPHTDDFDRVLFEGLAAARR